MCKFTFWTVLFLFSTVSYAEIDGGIQAKLAYLELLAGNIDRARQHIPKPGHLHKASGDKMNQGTSHPSLDFARQIWLYGEKQLALEALEYYTEGSISKDQANHAWLEFADSFLKTGQIPSA